MLFNQVHRVANSDEDRQVKRSFLLGCQQVTGLGCVDWRLLPVRADVSLSLCLKTEVAGESLTSDPCVKAGMQQR